MCKMRLFLYLFSLFIGVIDAHNDFELLVNQSPELIKLNVDSLPELSVAKPAQEEVSHFSLTTDTGIEVPVTMYNRKSNQVIIAAQALPAPKKSMSFLAHMFPTYDIVLFDYRWHGNYPRFVAKSFFTGSVVQKVLLDEEEELKTVVDYVLSKKQYQTVIGVGMCYGCYHLAKLQSDMVRANGVGPFTHLVFDSCWYSLRGFAERVCADPLLPIHPQVGGAPYGVTWITDSWLFKKIVLGLAFALVSDVAIPPYLGTLNAPVLFIHGRNDRFVPQDHFERIWQSANVSNRFALFTPFAHTNNLGNKKVYQYAVEAFISQTLLSAA